MFLFRFSSCVYVYITNSIVPDLRELPILELTNSWNEIIIVVLTNCASKNCLGKLEDVSSSCHDTFLRIGKLTEYSGYSNNKILFL